MERLQKYLARAGVASRRHCEEMIAAGLVKVNGTVVSEMGTRVNPLKDCIEVEGKRITNTESKVYIMLYKPRGYVTTMSDPKGRKKITDLLQNVKERVYPVGRLDYDSEGLLLLTNDGDLAFALTHPRHKVPKTYTVRVEGIPSENNLLRMSKGLPLEDGTTAPAQVEFVEIRDGNALLKITIHEGKNRQIRRMCEFIGHPVKRLKRTRIGPINLGVLKAGEYRQLTVSELRQLKSIAGLNEKEKRKQAFTPLKRKVSKSTFVG